MSPVQVQVCHSVVCLQSGDHPVSQVGDHALLHTGSVSVNIDWVKKKSSIKVFLRLTEVLSGGGESTESGENFARPDIVSPRLLLAANFSLDFSSAKTVDCKVLSAAAAVLNSVFRESVEGLTDLWKSEGIFPRWSKKMYNHQGKLLMDTWSNLSTFFSIDHHSMTFSASQI